MPATSPAGLTPGSASAIAGSLVGSRLGPYELRAELGRGGFGVVYRAFRPELNREFAAKVLIAGADAPPDVLARFRREAEAVATLGAHPGIAAVHDVGVEGGRHYLVMDLVDGVPLDAYVDERGRDWRHVVGLLVRVADAVAHAHARGVIHRDLKPGNILVEDGGQPRVLDFGLAKLRERGTGEAMTQSGLTLGTPDYMAPEQADGKVSAIGTWTDVHALGVLTYELLTGTLPYPGATLIEIVRKIVSEEPRPPHLVDRRIPREVSWVCLRALAKDPLHRYGTAREFGDDLRRLLRGEPVAAGPPSTLYRARKFVVRHRAAVGVAAIGAVACAVLAVASVRRIVLERDDARAARASAEAALAREQRLRELEQRAREARQSLADAERFRDVGAAPARVWAALDAALAKWPEGAEPRVARGLQQLHERRLDAAQRELEAAVQLEPGHYPAYIHLARLHWQRGDVAAMREAHDRLFALAPPNEFGAWARASRLWDESKPAEALAACDEALAMNPAFAMAHHTRGGLLSELGRPVEALAACDAAIAADPSYLPPYAHRAQTLLKLERWAEALEAYDAVLGDLPSDATLRSNRAVALDHVGRRDEALAEYDRALALAPTLASAWLNRGLLRQSLGHLPEALADLEHAAALEPTHAGRHAACAAVLLAMDRHADALVAAERAVALAPASAGAHAQRGAALAALDRRPEALAAFTEAARLAPGLALPRANLAFLEFEAGRAAEALAVADALVAALPDDPEAWWGRARVRHLAGRSDEALADLREAVARDPQDARWPVREGEILRTVGRYPDAAEAFARAAALSPGAMDVRWWLARSQLDAGDPAAAHVTLDAAITLDPAHADCRYLRGVLRERAGDRAGAREDAEAALAADPTHARAQYLCAVLDLETGRPAAAWRALRRAEALGYTPGEDFLKALRAAAPEPSPETVPGG